jgi:chromosome partitioning protein
MRTIAIINQKGGVGKTTTAVNLSAALAASGRRVCLVDLDPQAHASLHLGVSLPESALSIYDILTNGVDAAQVRQQLTENLWLVPSHLDLAAAELELADEPRRELLLRDRLFADRTDFDYVICDCPPSLGILTINALTFVREVILPLQPHFLALHGLSKLLMTIDVVSQRLNHDLRLTGVVLCLYDSGTRLAAEVSSDVAAFFSTAPARPTAWSDAIVFATRIRRNIRLAEAPSYGKSVFQYSPQSPGAEDYRRLASEVIASEASVNGLIAMPTAA